MISSLGHIFEKIAGICESAKEKLLITSETSKLYYCILPSCYIEIAEAIKISYYMQNASHVAI